MKFKVDQGKYLVLGYPSKAKPDLLRMSIFTKLSSAATVWERIQKPAGIYFIAMNEVGYPTITTLRTKQGFNTSLRMLNNPNTDLVTLDIIAMLSKTESFLAFDEMGNVLTDYVFINGYPVNKLKLLNVPKWLLNKALQDQFSSYIEEFNDHIIGSGKPIIDPRKKVNSLVYFSLKDGLSKYEVTE